MNRGNPPSSSLGVSSPPNVFGAVLDALVVILQRHLKRPLRQHGAFRDPFLVQLVLEALKPILTAEEERLATAQVRWQGDVDRAMFSGR